MVSRIISGAVVGIEGYEVMVEVDLARGIPSFTIVGLPNAAVRESRERVTAAIRNSGYDFPLKKITVNLAPADIRKEGGAFDLPIAVGIMLASGQLGSSRSDRAVYLGELALDGRLKPVKGVLPVVWDARGRGGREVIIPVGNHREAALVAGMKLAPCRNLQEVAEVLRGGRKLVDAAGPAPGRGRQFELDYSQVMGQETAKRALEVAAAGRHHLLMVGPPGAGKSMLAKRFPTIMPPFEEEEAIENARILSVTGRLNGGEIDFQPPFRSPHHSASDAGLVGGGRRVNPGEITLAHNGVLFLDELSEFRRNVLETLRQPIEDGCIDISRASCSVTYPADFQLLAAMNPCPCGYYGTPGGRCRCTPHQVSRYLSRISGPIIDRIPIHIEVRPVKPENFRALGSDKINSERIRKRVMKARDIQRKRYQEVEGVRRNSEIPLSMLEEVCRPEKQARSLLAAAQKKLRFSARSRKNIMQVARTIADLDGSEEVLARHIGESIQYRPVRYGTGVFS